MIYICFSLRSIPSNAETTEDFESLYNSVYKPFIKYINKNPDFKFTLSINGNFITYLKKKRKEYITLLRQLVDEKQVEILGGGYYDPALPLLLPVDRAGQIDKLTSEIRQTIGKRPRGITLFADSWDSSLVSSLQICGIEYVLLDSSIIPQDKKMMLPLIMNNLGKSIDIYPVYKNLSPKPEMTPQNFVSELEKMNAKENKKSSFIQFVPDRIVNIELSHKELANLLETKWFDRLFDYLKENPDIEVKTTTVQLYNKINTIKVPAHISDGINSEMVKLIQEFRGNTKPANSVHDFMESYPLCKKLYNRSLYIGMLINQYKKDKMRKNNARDRLWQAQTGSRMLIDENGTFLPTCYRQKSFKLLMEAEKILRDDETFKESVTSFDYNGDGFNEYVCRMKNYFSFISPISGAIQELELLQNSGNYADNLKRKEEFDGYDDNYERGFFVDHYFEKPQLEQYLEGKPAGDGIFSRIIYTELKFMNNHHEIQLFANALVGKNKQKIYLRKKYIINSDGMNIQYIIRNESDAPLKGYFAVESNIAHTNYKPEEFAYYKLDLLSEDSITEVNTAQNIQSQVSSEKLNNIDMARIIDTESGIIFGFEPNESCKYAFYPLNFYRNDSNKNKHPVHMTFVSTLYWDLNLDAGKEIEKTINFSLTSVKKTKNRTEKN